ncbi:hypothetical protein P152DRAFT_234925 [Eremomyces bilateralis CBS 781.70]|uniref:Uncharacterized protein n=1 Tax=Eremomyces bilateralis CBS 781.70 TaxID=1392243 RepID=A0A6G1GAH4_9PEZI|nr:uncharacterized protein P152DRAFT_234925 [Eremomyces bilateralis CBS 781.70]KAF1814839.1 hypothetical protein P152DRAFT_234925 [Eremomyces bilateralis CBS 781.70]
MATSQPSPLLVDLLDHINSISTDTTPLDPRLFEDCARILPSHITPTQSQSLILALYRLSFANPPHDLFPVTTLLEALIHPVAFDDILAIDPPVDFISGLALAARPFHSLCLSILEKAAQDASLARRLATTHPQAFVALVGFWLISDDEQLSRRAGNLLQDLLRVDVETGAGDEDPSGTPGSGIVSSAGWRGTVWRRVFRDRDTYEAIIRVCDTECHPEFEGVEIGERTVRQVRSTARARLLEWIPEVARMDWDAVTRDHLASETSCAHLKSFRYGLLELAVDHGYDKMDVVVYRIACNAISELITIQESWEDRYGLYRDRHIASLTVRSASSRSLEAIKSLGFHDRFTSMYLHPQGDHGYDELDMNLLGPAVVEYVMVYVSSYPDLFGQSPFCKQVLDKFETTFDQPPRLWGDDGAGDLAVLRFFPKRYLLQSPTPHQGINVLGFLDPKLGDDALLRTFAAVFACQTRGFGTVPSAARSADAHITDDDRSAARLLYYQFLEKYSNMWYFIGFHADAGPARKDVVLAALDLIDAMIDVKWSTSTAWITAEELRSIAERYESRPPTGILALISGEAMSNVVTNLMSIPKSMSLARDDDHAMHEIATRRFDVLAKLFKSLSREAAERNNKDEQTTLNSLAEQIQRRLGAGVWPRAATRATSIATQSR